MSVLRRINSRQWYVTLADPAMSRWNVYDGADRDQGVSRSTGENEGMLAKG